MNSLTVTLTCKDLVEALEFQNKIVKRANKRGVMVKHLEIASEATQTGRWSGADAFIDAGKGSENVTAEDLGRFA